MKNKVLNNWPVLFVAVLAMVAMVALLLVGSPESALATDPDAQSVSDVKLFDVADGSVAYGDASSGSVIKLFPNEFGVVDIYLTAALSETGESLITVVHSPDGSNAWVAYASGVYTFTAATAPAFQHVRVPVYGQALGFQLTIDGEDTTPEIYVVAKNNGGPSD